jgi:hypothetical protein
MATQPPQDPNQPGYYGIPETRETATAEAETLSLKEVVMRRTSWAGLLSFLVATLMLVSACSSGSGDGGSAVSQSGATDISDMLNGSLDPGSSGVLLRVPDGLDAKLVPASFSRNDIKAPTSMYVGVPTTQAPNGSGGPQCTGTQNESKTDGYSDTTGFVVDWCSSADAPPAGSGLAGADPFTMAGVGAVVGTNFDKYDRQVYYPTDANATDKRCHWKGGDPSNQDCPDTAGSGGAGTTDGKGCHPSQTDAPGPDGVTLVSDPMCQCNADLSGNDWGDWIDHWLQYAQDSPNQQPGGDNADYTFFAGNDESVPYSEEGGRKGKAPMFAMDWVSCWVSDVDDLVALQNAFWTNRARWFNGLVPQAPAELRDLDDQDGMKYYWGWNEIPIPSSFDKNNDDWDSLVIKLPAGTPSIADLSSQAQKDLSAGLSAFVKTNDVKLGSPQTAYALVLREEFKGGGWQREFICEAHDFADISLKYLPKDDPSSDGKGSCWLESTSPSS